MIFLLQTKEILIIPTPVMTQICSCDHPITHLCSLPKDLSNLIFNEVIPKISVIKIEEKEYRILRVQITIEWPKNKIIFKYGTEMPKCDSQILYTDEYYKQKISEEIADLEKMLKDNKEIKMQTIGYPIFNINTTQPLLSQIDENKFIISNYYITIETDRKTAIEVVKQIIIFLKTLL